MGITLQHVHYDLYVPYEYQFHEPHMDHSLIPASDAIDLFHQFLLHDSSTHFGVYAHLRQQNPNREGCRIFQTLWHRVPMENENSST